MSRQQIIYLFLFISSHHNNVMWLHICLYEFFLPLSNLGKMQLLLTLRIFSFVDGDCCRMVSEAQKQILCFEFIKQFFKKPLLKS